MSAINETVGRINLTEFARIVGLPRSQIIECMHELQKENLLKRVNSGYAITVSGRNLVKALMPVQAGMEFHFYTAIGQPTPHVAKNLKEFYDIIRHVDTVSIEFHLYRGDFEKWLGTAVNDTAVTMQLVNLKNEKLIGEPLRNKLIELLDAEYSLEKLSY
ncbi:MAG: DUF5752 family protein [Candidatus Bathyarchaeia archaeon]